MANTAMDELQQQVEQVRREAFAAGYAAAMQVVREVASRLAPNERLVTGRSLGGAKARETATTPANRRKVQRSEGVGRPRRSVDTRPQRGSNAKRIEEILQAAAPRALRQAEIRKALQDKGIEVSFTSVRQGLSQLEARNAAEQLGNSKTWRIGRGASG